ncbi:hypothetical protein ACN47E_005213 [Coniothyrium glycines]
MAFMRLSSLLGTRRIASKLHGKQTIDNEDWTDASSDDDVASGPNARTQMSPLPYLLDRDLPPCGPIPQVAYQNVNNRLRKLWTSRAGTSLHSLTLPAICNMLLAELEQEAKVFLSTSLQGTRDCEPRCREDVFTYEIRWARYFVREAKALEARKEMTDDELEKQDFQDRLYPIPKDLEITVKNSANRRTVYGMWTKWHQMKRRAVGKDETDPGLSAVVRDVATA